jgi:TP901 family phage tail tape measure protein
MPSYKLDILVNGHDNGATSVLLDLKGGLGALNVAMGNLLADGVKNLGGALLDLGKKGIAAAMDFDQTMSGVKAVTGATAQEFDALSASAMRIGKDTAFSAKEAASSIEMLAKNGLKVPDILNGAADAAVNLAAATGLKGEDGLSTAADIATDAMADFNIKAADMARAINGISGVTVNSKFDINGYKLALSQAGGVAGAVGVNFEDFNTSIAAIAPLFASGSDAGTSFKVFLQDLIPKSKDATAAMGRLGLMSYDQQQILTALRTEGLKPTGDAFQDLANYALALTKGDAKKASDQLEKWARNGAFMKNEFFDANGQMKSMADVAGLLGKALAGLSDQEKSDALKDIFGTDASRAAVGLAQAGAEGFTQLAASIKQVDAAAQAATRLDNLAGDVEQLRGSLETTEIQMGQAFTPALRTLTQAATSFINTHFIDRDWSPLVGGLERAVSAITGFVGTIQTALAEGGPLSSFTNLGVWLRDQWTAALPGLEAAAQEWAHAAAGWAQDAIPQALTWLLDLRNQAVGFLLRNAPALIDTLHTWSLALLNWIVDAIPGMLERFGTATVQLIGLIGQYAPMIVTKLGDWALALAQWAVDAAPGLLKNLGSTVGRLLDAVGAAIPGIVDALAAWGAKLVDWVIDAAPGLLANLLDLNSKLLGWIAERVPGIAAQLGEWAVRFLDWVGPTIPKLLIALGGLVEQLLQWVIDQSPALLTKLGEWSAQFGTWARETGLPALGAALLAIANGLWDEIKTDWNKAFQSGAMGEAIVNAIKNGIASNWAAFKAWLWSQVTGLFGGGNGSTDTGTGNGSSGSWSGPTRASGGPVSRNTAYLVGENGPELFVPGASGSIIPNGALRGTRPSSYGGGGGGGMTWTGNLIVQDAGDPRATALAVRDELMRMGRDNGNIFGGYA